jgi:CO/xanthine dehydrogenase FAD-binding subunit
MEPGWTAKIRRTKFQMRPSEFEYHRAENLGHALELLARFGDEGRPIAGGQSLVPMMNLRLAQPTYLIDINGLPLDDLYFDGSILRIGALMRHHRYLDEAVVAEHFPALLEAANYIGHPTIRRNGTLGGSISHADPTAELPAVCLLYDATIVARSQAAERRIPAADFFLGAYTTALEPGELVTSIEFTVPPANTAGTFIEMAERRGDFATASVGATIEFDHGTITKSAVVCSGAELRPIRASSVETFLIGRKVTDAGADEAGRLLAGSVDPVHNHIASSEYRRGLIGELAKRAIATACSRAQG